MTESVKAPAPTPKKTKQLAQSAPEPDPEPAEAQGAPPDVVGLSLPSAQKLLKNAGYKPDVSNTDTALGIIDPNNYTVCKESDPVGNLVPILAQKYGC